MDLGYCKTNDMILHLGGQFQIVSPFNLAPTFEVIITFIRSRVFFFFVFYSITTVSPVLSFLIEPLASDNKPSRTVLLFEHSMLSSQ